jgi:hypothetical protein
MESFKTTEQFDAGVLRLKKLQDEKKEWNIPGKTFEWTEDALKVWLLRRLKGWPEFQTTYNGLLSAQQLLSWDEVLDRAKKFVNVLKTAAGDDVPKRPGTVMPVGMYKAVSNSNASIPMAAMTFGTEEETLSTENVVMAATPGNWKPRACYNCGKLGHIIAQCRSLRCRFCQKVFTSFNALDYHMPSVCPWNKFGKQNGGFGNNSIKNVMKARLRGGY